MNNLSSIFKTLRRALCLSAVALPIAVSCTDPYDDTELRDKIDALVNQLYDLEQKLNSEIKSLKDMIDGKIVINKVTSYTDGTTVLELSNGEKITLLKKTDLKSFVTCITLSDGKQYWGYINANGEPELFYDENGQSIPVIADTPEVIIKDGETYIVIGGKEYPMSGNSIFSDYELIKDELSGETLAVRFTFGEDMTFTVAVDGSQGLHFVLYRGFSYDYINDYYVPCGTTADIMVSAVGVVDYVLQIPDGWRVKETESPMGKYFSVTAPSAQLVESGVAVAEGELKVVSVLEGGKASVSKLYLTTKPFKEVAVSLSGVEVTTYTGLQKYAYGVVPASQYDEAQILATVQDMLDSYSMEYPTGYGLATENISTTIEEIAGKTLTPGMNYVVWVIPAIYVEDEEKEGYYVNEGTFQHFPLSYGSVKFEISQESFNDAQLSIDLEGVTGYYMSVVKKENYYAEDVARLLNEGYYTKHTTPTYNGSIFTLAGVTGEKDTEYVAWLVIAEDGKTYLPSDVMAYEFSTIGYTAGSTLKVSAEAEASSVDITATIKADGATDIYYSVIKANQLKNYPDEESKVNYLFGSGKSVEAESVEVKASEFISKITPKMDLVFLALAVDANGKYTEVLCETFSTTAMSYNDLAVELEVLTCGPDKVEVSISADGAADYLYWAGKTTDYTWTSSRYLGGTAETAQAFMAQNSTDKVFTEAAAAYPLSNGKITITGHDVRSEYVVVAVAKDENGIYSKASLVKFLPYLGTLVETTDSKWEAAKPTVEWAEEYFEPSTNGLFARYAFNITLPKDYTAYILCSNVKYFETDDRGNPWTLSREELMMKIIEIADKRADRLTDTDSDSTEAHYTYYAHGGPTDGNVVLWANEAFHEKLCKVPDYHEKHQDAKVYYNDGSTVFMANHYAAGQKDVDYDNVYVVLQDLDGNCYEPYEFIVPHELFAKVQ